MVIGFRKQNVKWEFGKFLAPPLGELPKAEGVSLGKNGTPSDLATLGHLPQRGRQGIDKHQFADLLSKADSLNQFLLRSRLSQRAARRVPTDWKIYTSSTKPMTAAHMTRNLKL